MVHKQASILQAAARLVKPGGRLVYATCSLLREENEEIAERFIAANTDFTLTPANEILKSQGIELDTGAYFRVLPHTHAMDGFFAAAMARNA